MTTEQARDNDMDAWYAAKLAYENCPASPMKQGTCLCYSRATDPGRMMDHWCVWTGQGCYVREVWR